MFELIKYQKKEYFSKWITEFRNLLLNRLLIDSMTDFKSAYFEPSYQFYDKIDEIECFKGFEELKFRYLAIAIKSGALNNQKLALNKIKFLMKNEKIVSWVFDNEIINKILSQENLEIFNMFVPVLKQIGKELDCSQIKLIYNYIRSSNIGQAISDFIRSICLILQKGVILTIFSFFSMENSEEVLFATEFTEKILEIFPFTYQDYNTQFFINLLHSENVTFNNFAIIILSKLYYRFALNPKVTSEIIDHIKNIKKKFFIVQNARLLIEIDKLNINFRFLISEKSAKSAVSSLISKEIDKAYPRREKIQYLFRYLELYIKQSKSLEKSMFTDVFYSLQNTDNEDILSEWVNRCIVFCPPDITDEIFHCLFLDNSDYSSWTVYTFKCFMCMYLLLNSFDRCIELKKGELIMRLQRVLKYTDSLIEVALLGNQEIFSESCQILVNLHMNLGESLNKIKKNIWDDFFCVLLKRSEDNLDERILNVIYSFLKQPFGRLSGNLMLFLYKTCDESDYTEIYVEENSDVRMLKIKIGEKYGKDYWNISLRCDNVKYNRFQDDMKIKTLKSNLIIVELENDNPEVLNFGEYIAQSLEIQNYLMRTLSDEKPYSKLSLNILCLINFNSYLCSDLHQLSKNIEEIIPKSFFSFSFYSKLVEKFMIDHDWTEKFFIIQGVEYVLEIFNSTFTKDLVFNQCFLAISVCFTMKYPQLITSKLVKRIFFAYSVLVLSILDKDDSVYESLLQIKQLKVEIFEEILEDEKFFQQFWVNVVILSKNIIISVQIMKFFLEYSEKSGKCLRLTLMFVINTLSNPELNRKYQFEVYDFIKNLTILAEDETFYMKLADRLKDSLNFNQKNLVAGLLHCLITEKFKLKTEFLISILNEILSHNKPFGFSKRIRRNLFELISVQFSVNKDLDKFKVCDFFLSLNTDLIKTDWNISPDSINLENFDYTKLVKQGNKIFINSLIQQLYLQPEYKQSLKSTSDAGPLTFLVQKLFSKLEKYSKLLFNPKSIYDEFEKLNILPSETPTNICIYTKTFIKRLNKEHKNNEKLFPMQGVLSFDNQVTKGCDHLLSKDSKNFLYLSLALKYKNISTGINKIFMPENKKVKCKECGNFNYLQSKKLIMKYPEVLVVLLERFSQFEYSKNVPACNRYYCEFENELNLKNYQHGDSTETNTKYELAGIISYNSALNCFISYCKVNLTWVKFKDESVKLLKNQNFFKDLFGVASEADIKSKINTACVLVFNKCVNNNRTVSLNSETFMSRFCFYRNFLVSAEFLGFANEIIIKESSELLRFCFKYFFRFVVRIRHVETLMEISKNICFVLRTETKNSELLLEVIKDEEFVDVLLDCEDLFKSQLIGDLVFVALQNSRPSAYIRLFGFFLDHADSAITYKSEVYFEIIYNICKLNPALAIEEGANSKLFSLISHFKALEKIPAFLLASYSLFYPYTSKHQLEILSDPILINLALKSDHNYLTSSELGKMIGKINDTKLITTYLSQQLETHNKENLQQKFLIVGLLSVLESAESLQNTINLLMKLLKNKKKYEPDCFYCIIEVTFLALLKNKHFCKSVIDHPKFVKEISKALNGNKILDSFSFVSSEKMQEILKAIKKKTNLPVQLTEQQNFNVARKSINATEVILEINNTTYYQTGQKFKFHNSITGKFT